MQFRIADSFTDSLVRLTGDEQKAVKTTAFDLQMNPANPGLSFHKLDRAKDKNFWSVRVNSDVRIIVHRTGSSLLLCYVDHHDRAYAWAERRKLETHPKTGAAQLVEIRERVREIVVPVYVPEEAPPAQPVFADTPDVDLLRYGVPEEWIADVKNVDEEGLLELAEHLPAEAAEALLELATGGRPELPVLAEEVATPFDHPDAQRRFRVVTDVEELERALEYPWEKWTIFLHPQQRRWVERAYSGPARVAGTAGTGKTVVALHRAVHLARAHPDARVLLATFSDPLARALQIKLRRLVGNEPRLAERIDVYSLDALVLRLHRAQGRSARLVDRDEMRSVLEEASAAIDEQPFNQRFLLEEWEQVVDTWQLDSWEAYRNIPRLGRKTRLPESRRAVLWRVCERARELLAERELTTLPAVYAEVTAELEDTANPPFEFAVVDEAQDLSVAQLRFLAALGAGRPEALFFAGDLGQRIFQPPFSWKSLGVDVRGRSHTLRVNYRTSHQIRRRADRLLGPELADADGNVEDRRGTVSVFNGPEPEIHQCEDEVAEAEQVAAWIRDCLESGMESHEVAVFVRDEEQLERASAAVAAALAEARVLDRDGEPKSGRVSVSTMHLAKGLEFRAVVVMACDDEVIPSQKRIETVGDEADLKEVYDTERHLLYVACTRARDRLLVAGVAPASEFLEDLRS